MAISLRQDLDNPELVAEVTALERRVLVGVQGVPQISFRGRALETGAQHETVLATAILDIQGACGQCDNGLCIP